MLERARALFHDVCGADSPFVTVVIARVDAATGRVELVSGGHPPPVMGSPDGTHRRLEISPAPPLGVPSTRPPEVTRVDAEPGAWLALFSDGVFESRTMSMDDAIDQALAPLGDGPPDPSVLIAAGEAIPDRTEDDRVMIVVGRTPAVRSVPVGTSS